MVHSYRDLLVWQRSIELVISIYQLTAHFPQSELYGLISQMRRAALSIAANIAEGRRRGSRKDFRQFLLIAYGSGAELETYLVIVKRLPFGKHLEYAEVESLLEEVMRMLNVMIKKLA